MASLTISNAQLHVVFTKVVPIPMGRCGCRYDAPCFSFSSAMASASFFSKIIRVVEDMMSVVFLGTSPATTVVSTLAKAVTHSVSRARSTKCSFRQPSLWGDERGGVVSGQVRRSSSVTSDKGCSSRGGAIGPYMSMRSCGSTTPGFGKRGLIASMVSCVASASPKLPAMADALAN